MISLDRYCRQMFLSGMIFIMYEVVPAADDGVERYGRRFSLFLFPSTVYFFSSSSSSSPTSLHLRDLLSGYKTK